MITPPPDPTNIPLFIRKLILDFVETALAAIFLVNVAFPTSFAQTGQVFVIVGVAVFSALVSALRRATPDFIEWLRLKLAVG